MTGYLIDTNAILIALTTPGDLPRKVRSALLSGPNVLSVVSYWEVVIKSMKGSLKVGDPGRWWQDALNQLAATPLALRPEHVTEIHGLPPIHKDPFDRVLIAQATVEELELVSTNGAFRRYASSRLRVIS